MGNDGETPPKRGRGKKAAAAKASPKAAASPKNTGNKKSDKTTPPAAPPGGTGLSGISELGNDDQVGGSDGFDNKNDQVWMASDSADFLARLESADSMENVQQIIGEVKQKRSSDPFGLEAAGLGRAFRGIQLLVGGVSGGLVMDCLYHGAGWWTGWGAHCWWRRARYG